MLSQLEAEATRIRSPRGAETPSRSPFLGQCAARPSRSPFLGQGADTPSRSPSLGQADGVKGSLRGVGLRVGTRSRVDARSSEDVVCS